MEINPDIKAILKGCKIDYNQGTLCLLAIYFNLDADKIIPDALLKQINLTKIIEKDYTSNTIVWNIPLFVGQEGGSFDWVQEWMHPFGAIGGPSRKGTTREVITRMKAWFAKHPEYRKDDVFAARDLYFRTEQPKGQFVKTSHKFISEGTGPMEVSLLLLWCERNKELANTNSSTNTLMRGKLM